MVAITDIRMMAAHVGDVITIDNFNAEMTKFNECAKPLFGLVDMGRLADFHYRSTHS